MSKLRSVGLSLGLALTALGSAHAAPTIGSGGGYYGTAQYGGGVGSIVGAYSTWNECNNALLAAINYNVNINGYTLISMRPCLYNTPYTGVISRGFELTVVADGEGGTANVAAVLLDEVRRIRQAHRADAYDAAIGELVRITYPNGDNRTVSNKPSK